MWWMMMKMMNTSIGVDFCILYHFDSNMMEETIYFLRSDDTANDADAADDTTDRNPVAESNTVSYISCCCCGCGTLIMLEIAVIFVVLFVVISSVHIEFSLNDTVVIVFEFVVGRAYSSTHMDSTVFEWNEFVWLQQQQQQQ